MLVFDLEMRKESILMWSRDEQGTEKLQERKGGTWEEDPEGHKNSWVHGEAARDWRRFPGFQEFGWLTGVSVWLKQNEKGSRQREMRSEREMVRIIEPYKGF